MWIDCPFAWRRRECHSTDVILDAHNPNLYRKKDGGIIGYGLGKQAMEVPLNVLLKSVAKMNPK